MSFDEMSFDELWLSQKFCINVDKNFIGVHFGANFHKLIRSPCLRNRILTKLRKEEACMWTCTSDLRQMLWLQNSVIFATLKNGGFKAMPCFKFANKLQYLYGRKTCQHFINEITIRRLHTIHPWKTRTGCANLGFAVKKTSNSFCKATTLIPVLSFGTRDELWPTGGDFGNQGWIWPQGWRPSVLTLECVHPWGGRRGEQFP
jgi:hypothetical protein